MAQVANITVKKFDGTTDIIYTALVGAAGDGKPALWRANTVSAIPAQCPTFELSSRSNQNGTTRIMSYQYAFPVVQTINGVPTVTDIQRGNGTIPVLQGADWTQVREGIVQQLNLLSAALVRTSILEGFAPRS